MAEKLLLSIYYECARYKSEIPWDSIAHRFHPGSSGGAILQHLARLRNTLISEGHIVPPLCQKPGSRAVVDPAIRGYIRSTPEGADDVYATRPVLYSEPIEDRRFNLPDAVDRGSRGRVVDESALILGVTPPSRKRPRAPPSLIKRESPDPADLDSDEEYVPGINVKSGPRRSARAKKIKYTEDTPEDELEDEETASQNKDEQPATNDAAEDNSALAGEQASSDGEDDEGRADDTEVKHDKRACLMGPDC
jgi:hypothetical protein